MDEFEKLLIKRDYYEKKMGEVLNGTIHLCKEWTRVRLPLSKIQKDKDYFLFKYYEFRFNETETLIKNSIYNIWTDQ